MLQIEARRPVQLGHRRLCLCLVLALGTAVLGCGGSETTTTVTAADAGDSSTTTSSAEELEVGLDQETLTEIDDLDTELDDQIHAFQEDLATCQVPAASGQIGQAVECFDDVYRPYSLALSELLAQLISVAETADDDCGAALELATESLRKVQADSEELRGAFTSRDFGDVNPNAFGNAYGIYRSNMDSALQTCSS